MTDIMNVRPGEEFDAGAVADCLRAAGLAIGAGPLTVQQFGTGSSNLTYLLRSATWEGVLRRPPLGPVAPKAHDMAREQGILQRLHPVFPLAPKPFYYCGDPGVIGAPFYVMEARHGVVLDRSFPSGWTYAPEQGRVISTALVDTLVDLHAVDYQAAGLGEIGHPTGYMQRQVDGWLGRWERAKTAELPEVAFIAQYLAEHLPESPAPTIVHNDFKLNNLMLAADSPGRIVAVLDWEMATVGDPLSDVGTLLAYWQNPGEEAVLGKSMDAVTRNPGFFTRGELLQRYAERSGRDVESMPFYVACATFKVAVIVQQIYYRWYNGQTRDERFRYLGAAAVKLVQRAATIAQTGQL